LKRSTSIFIREVFYFDLFGPAKRQREAEMEAEIETEIEAAKSRKNRGAWKKARPIGRMRKSFGKAKAKKAKRGPENTGSFAGGQANL
jgi:hypothetical protein